jgi:hypothetical protein|tara:strand:+ start:26579 stop:27757 length:1179 start_codon:yes stop_codon:yes gene_type:complete
MRLIELQIERPKSDKNFPRNIMPQIRKGDIKDSPFDYTKHNVDIETLMPVQNQRVKGMHDRAKRGFADGSIRPIVIDKNNYIVNGHHRFDVALQMGIKKLDVLKVNATIEELIDHFSNTSSDAATFEELMKQKMAKAMEGEVVTFPGTYVKRDYVTINGVKMLRDVWDYMTQDREEEHGYDNNMNTVKKGIKNFTGDEDPKVLKKSYQIELRNFIDEFENQGMDPQPFIDELEQIGENYKSQDVTKQGRNLSVKVKQYLKDKKTKLTTIKVADLQMDKPGFDRIIGDLGDVNFADTTDPIVVDADGKTILDGFHRVQKALNIGKKEIPAYMVVENFADGKKKGKSRPGRVKKAGASCKGSVTSLRKKAKNSSGEKSKMYHWCANMKSGRKKS